MMDKGKISAGLFGAGFGGLGSMIGAIWGESFGSIKLGVLIGTILGMCLATGILIAKYELMEVHNR